MKDTTKFKCWLAVLITIAVIGLIYLLMYVEIPAGSKEIIYMALGALLKQLADIFSYYYGSSEGSDKKTDIIAQSQPLPPGALQ